MVQEQVIREERIKTLETLNNELQQSLQGKTNLKKLERECNQLQEENSKLQHQRKEVAEQYEKLCKEMGALQEG